MSLDFNKIRFILQNYAHRKLALGFSGGVDSTALLLILETLRAEFHYELSAVHFNHHLRGAESDLEACHAEEFCNMRSIAFRKIDLTLDLRENLEDAARRARMNAWQTMRNEFDAVALAHHADDRIETLLMRIFRGSGVQTLDGLKPLRTLNEVTYLRPLLGVHRNELEAYLIQQNVDLSTCAHDSSNQEDRYFRNFIRKHFLAGLFPQFPFARAGFVQTVERLSEEADFLEQSAQAAFAEIQTQQKIPLAFFRTLHPALQSRVFQLWLEEFLPPASSPFTLTAGTWRRIKQLFSTAGTEQQSLPLGHGMELQLRHETLSLATPATVNHVLWNYRTQAQIAIENYRFTATILSTLPDRETLCHNGAKVVFFDAEQLPDQLELAPRQPGEWMTVFGETAPRRLKKLLTNAKLPDSKTLPLLRHPDTGAILWIPGVRAGAWGNITAATRIALQIELEHISL